MEREILDLEVVEVIDIYQNDSKEYKLIEVIMPNYISEDDANDIGIVFKRLEDDKFFGTELASWGDNNYDLICEIKEVFPTQKTITVYN